MRHFLQRRVDNIEQLEIVLLLQQHQQRMWTGAAVADTLRLSPRAAAEHLETLARRALLDVRIGDDVRYRFNPATPELTATVKHVFDCYRDRRGEVVALVAGTRRSLQDFADSFRLKDEHDG